MSVLFAARMIAATFASLGTSGPRCQSDAHPAAPTMRAAAAARRTEFDMRVINRSSRSRNVWTSNQFWTVAVHSRLNESAFTPPAVPPNDGERLFAHHRDRAGRPAVEGEGG